MKNKTKDSHAKSRPGFIYSNSQRRYIRSRSKDAGASSGLVRRKLPSGIIDKLKKLSESGMGFQLVVLVMKDGKHHSHIKVLNGAIALVPKGLNINEVINVRLAKGKKPKAKGEPTGFGILLMKDNLDAILKMGSGIVHWGSGAGIEPLKKDVQGKPVYLMAKFKCGKTAILGIGKAQRLEAHKTRIKVLRKFGEEKKIKLLGNPNTRGPVIKRDLIHFLDAKKVEPAKAEDKAAPKAMEKILSSSVGDPTADAGAHRHPSLVRTEGRVFAGHSSHFHKVVDETGRVHVTDIDGDHPHGLDGDQATEEGSEHDHTLGLPEDLGGGFVKTDQGTPHSHPALTQSTGFGGPHTHKVKINGKEFTTLTAEEESMIMPGGLGDSPGMQESPLGVLGLAEAMGIDAKGDVDKALDEIIKQASPQAVILSKQKFSTLEDAKTWIKNNGFLDEKVQETSNTFVFTQFADGKCKKGTLKTIRPKGSMGVQLSICMTKKDEPEGKLTEKQVVQESSIKVHKTSLGFTSFIRRGDKIFGTDQKATGKTAGNITLLEMDRMDGDAMSDAPPGAKEAIMIEEAEGDPKKLAKDNLGRRIFVMKKVGDRLVEQDIFLAVIDPTKSEKEDCGCQDKK